MRKNITEEILKKLTGFVYDGEEYYGDECGECEPIEVFQVIVDGNGNVDTSFLEEEDFEGF